MFEMWHSSKCAVHVHLAIVELVIGCMEFIQSMVELSLDIFFKGTMGGRQAFSRSLYNAVV